MTHVPLRSQLAAAIAVWSIAGAPCPAGPLENPQSSILSQVRFEQRLDAQVPVELEFQDDRGRRIALAECMAQRPTVLVLAYYRCPMLCNQVLEGLARSLQGIDLAAGKDFQVVVVSFDPSDTVELAASKKQAVLDAYGRQTAAEGWHFLIGAPADVGAVAQSVGFTYQYDEATKQYAHASGIVLVTPAGRVSRYFYGIDYPTRDVRLGLVEASNGRIGSLVDELLLLCFHYDPLTGRYGLAIMRIIRGAGVLTVVALAGFIWRSLRRDRAARLAAADPIPAQPTS
ncbi:MAG TPA: SCO family protein [Lacipirellulaceae bacterium]|nr:SCO family protein [Lacipirellulaceae bacterium]